MPLDNSWLSAGGDKTMFGHADWMALRGRGITSAQQLAKLRDNQQYLRGPQYKDGVLTHRGNKEGVAYSQKVPGYGYSDSSGVEHSGGLFNQIRLHAQRQAKPWSSMSGVNDWDYGIWGNTGFGAKDIEEARNRGASAYQLKQLADRAGQLGINIDNPDAQAVLANAPASPWDFGAHGAWGFGKKDIEAMDAAGWDLDKVKSAKQFAQDQKLNIGPEVDPWILRKQGERDDAANVEWQTNMLDPLNQQMADLTAQINEPVEKPGVGYSTSSVVGKSGATAARLQTSRRGNRRGIKSWKRSSWSMPTVNTGSTSGKSGNNPGLNVL